MIKWGIIFIWLILINGIIIPFVMYGIEGPKSFGAPFAHQIFMSMIIGVLTSIVADAYFDVEEEKPFNALFVKRAMENIE